MRWRCASSGYWQFFEAPTGWGRIPVRGLGAVSSAVRLQARLDGMGHRRPARTGRLVRRGRRARAEQRAAELGEGPLQRRIGAAWAAFAERVPDLLDVEHGSRVEAVERAYDALVDGSADPGRGVVLAL